MALFTIFSLKQPSWERPPFDELLSVAPIQPTAVVQQSLSRGQLQWHVQALATPTGFHDVDDQTSIEPRSTVLIRGYAYRYDKPEPEVMTAKQLGEGFSVSRFDELAGEYAVAHLDESGTLTALADPQGLQGLFYVETEDVFGVSTRPSMLALLARRRTMDTRSLAWISSIGFRIGTATSFRDVRAVPQGQALIWDGRLRFARRKNPLALGDQLSIGLRRRPRWFEDQLERGVAAAGTAVQLACGQGSVDLAITGGKDSRVVLALCLAAGLRERLTLYTTGVPDHPDVVVGKMIGDAVGVPHRANTPKALDGSSLSADDFMHQLAGFAYQADGLAGAWDNFLTLRTGVAVSLSGHMGEVLKAYAKRPFDPSKPIDPIELVKLQAPFDPMGVLYPAARDGLRDELHDQLERHRASGFASADLPDVFYYANRVPNWLGALRQIQPFQREFVRPLAVPPLMEIAFVATAAERKKELIHFEIINKLAPQLIDIPFAMQSWHPDLGAPKRDPVLVPQQSSARGFGSWQFSANQAQIRDRLVQMIFDTSESSLWNAVDAQKLIRRLRGPDFRMMELISLLGILPGAMFSTERFTPLKLETPSSEVTLSPYEWPQEAKQQQSPADQPGFEAKSRPALVDDRPALVDDHRVRVVEPRDQTRPTSPSWWKLHRRRLRKLVRRPRRFLTDSRFRVLRKAASVSAALSSSFSKLLARVLGRST